MSINNIVLPHLVLQELFKTALVMPEVEHSKTNTATADQTISYLGNNQQHIAIIVEETESLYLGDEDLQFLMGILNACKLSMADVAVINLNSNPSISYHDVADQLKAVTVLMFHVTPEVLQLPLQFPHYQVQQFNNQFYLSAPALNIIASDKNEKTKLWNSLKKVFHLG